MKKKLLLTMTTLLALCLLAGCTSHLTPPVAPTVAATPVSTPQPRDDEAFVFQGGVYSKVNGETAWFVAGCNKDSTDLSSAFDRWEQAATISQTYYDAGYECHVIMLYAQDSKLDFETKPEESRTVAYVSLCLTPGAIETTNSAAKVDESLAAYIEERVTAVAETKAAEASASPTATDGDTSTSPTATDGDTSTSPAAVATTAPDNDEE